MRVTVPTGTISPVTTDSAADVTSVPFAIEISDRIPSARYHDPEFFRLEAEQLWSRTWQMAARLEEIPRPGDVTTYTILDQSVIVARGHDGVVRAFENTCRHRGVELVVGRTHCNDGFTCPFHGWCYDLDGTNTKVTKPATFAEHNLVAGELGLTPVRCETWGGCAWINLDPAAPPLRDCIEPFASTMDAWRIEDWHAEWWYACRLPVNWKLAQEAFVEQYHVIETHPQLRIPGRYPPKPGDAFDPAQFVDSELHYLHMMSEGMAGMMHANDVAVAEGLRDIELPADPIAARNEWERQLNDAVVAWHREHNHPIPDLNTLSDAGTNEPMGYCFPHFFILPMYSSASSYRFRPLGPEETLMEIWSLTRFPNGEEPIAPPVPEVWGPNDDRWPPIPRQDFSNLPRQQRGLHARGFEYMRLSAQAEGHISNFHRVLDGFLAGRPTAELAPALRHLNVNPLVMPIVDLGI